MSSSQKFSPMSIDMLVTLPEKLPSWEWFDPRYCGLRSVTANLCGDPPFMRSALSGWKQLGDDYLDASHGDSHRRVRLRGEVKARLSDG